MPIECQLKRPNEGEEEEEAAMKSGSLYLRLRQAHVCHSAEASASGNRPPVATCCLSASSLAEIDKRLLVAKRKKEQTAFVGSESMASAFTYGTSLSSSEN